MRIPPPADELVTPDWPEMDPEEQAALRAAFDEAEAEYQRGESLPVRLRGVGGGDGEREREDESEKRPRCRF